MWSSTGYQIIVCLWIAYSTKKEITPGCLGCNRNLGHPWASPIAIEITSKITAKREKARWDKLSPEEQRKEQEAAYRQQAFSNT